MCWGVRDLKKYRLGSVTSPFIKIECGGEVMTTSHIVNTRRNPNFTDLPIIMTLVSLYHYNVSVYMIPVSCVFEGCVCVMYTAESHVIHKVHYLSLSPLSLSSNYQLISYFLLHSTFLYMIKGHLDRLHWLALILLNCLKTVFPISLATTTNHKVR